MKKEKYVDNRKGHLKEYAEGKGMPIGGTYNYRGTIVTRDHILKIEDGQTKRSVIEKYNVLNGVKCDLLKKLSPHSKAHHLNSSQILCYNFFRPYIDENGGATQELVDRLLEQGISIEKGAKCTFEYEDDLGDGTQFDFHIASGETKVFFEVKYTENCFGEASSSDAAKRQYKNWYEVQFTQQQCLKEVPADCEDFIANYTQHYQLYRNAIRITDKNKHLVLLYPKENENVEKEAQLFYDQKINDDYKENVHLVHWENIVDKESELYKKYFAE